MVFVIEGTQWGDEGKGKITDLLAQKMDIVCRHQGGNNAGHSIVINGIRYALSSLPSGILSENITNVITNGCVVNPDSLINEMNALKAKGIKNFKLLISNRAHLIMPYHIALDGAYEHVLGTKQIGTTKRGIGPCYQDKAERIGIRFGDLLEESYLKERLDSALIIKNKELEMLHLSPFSSDDLYRKLLVYKEILAPYITDTSVYLNNAIKENKKILFEGAQGAMLCIEEGTYPYVTSSSPMSNSVPINASIPASSITKVIGIMKAYTTRVGAGPFISELKNAEGETIREKGHEYGTVTHRPRRIGYLDLVVVKHTTTISGVNTLALMLIDCLTDISPLKVCVSYKLDGKVIDYIPSTISELERCEPIYKDFETWNEDISKVRNYEDLPDKCKTYIKFIEDYLSCPISIISVGPGRDETIFKEDVFK